MQSNDSLEKMEDVNNYDTQGKKDENKKKSKKGGIIAVIFVVILFTIAVFGGYELLVVKPHNDAHTAFLQEADSYNSSYDNYIDAVDSFNAKVNDYNQSVEELKSEIDKTSEVIASGSAYDKSLVEKAKSEISKLEQKLETLEIIEPEDNETFSDEGMKTGEIKSLIENIQLRETEIQGNTAEIKDQTSGINIPDYSNEIQILQKYQKNIKDSIDVNNKLTPSENEADDGSDSKSDTNADEENAAFYNPFLTLKFHFPGLRQVER